LTLSQGQTYDDYDASTDKKANYGLTGLILGGVGLAVAKKVGLLATTLIFFKKFFFVLLAPLAWVWNKIRGKSRKSIQSPESDVSRDEDDTQSPTAM
jgi:uncharacterized membrane-anchored protein